MACEGILQYRVRQNLSRVFSQRLAVLDWDTHNTGAGRPDAVFLTDSGQLMVVEFECMLSTANIEHSLITQAWKGAERWYFGANRNDVLSFYEYSFAHRFPNKTTPPDIREVLGLEPRAHDLWDRRKGCIIVAAAPRVDAGVIEVAQRAVERHLAATDSRMPFEAWVYTITGKAGDADIEVEGCDATLIAKSEELDTAVPEGPGLPVPHQHRRGELTSEFRQVEAMLPKYMSDELEREAGYYLYCKADFGKVLKLMPWHEYDVDVCFEFSTMDQSNDIKGPHCQLRVGKLRSLGMRIQKELVMHLPDIATVLGCKVDDLECKGSGWPLKQYRASGRDSSASMSPEDIARALGRFCSVVYPIINPLVRSALE